MINFEQNFEKLMINIKNKYPVQTNDRNEYPLGEE